MIQDVSCWDCRYAKRPTVCLECGNEMIFGSACSGIEAVSVAWEMFATLKARPEHRKARRPVKDSRA